MAILTNAGLSKYNAAVAAGSKITIKKAVFGSNSGVVSAATTDVGTPVYTYDRVHLHSGFSTASVALAIPVVLPDAQATHQVGYYDADNTLVAVDQVTLPAKTISEIWRIVRGTLFVAKPEVFDSLLSSPKALASSRAIIQAVVDCYSSLDKHSPPSLTGSLLKFTGYTAVPDVALSQVSIARSASELDQAKNSIPSMADMFANWERFSHAGSTYPGNANELNGWSLVNGDTLATNINSATYIGLLSPAQYLNYELDVQITSNSGDDDLGGLVIASTHQNGIHYTLSAIRCLGGLAQGWKLVYNYNQTGAKTIVNKSNSVIWGDGIAHSSPTFVASDVTPPYVQNGGWSRNDISAGTRIVVTRNGDLITAQCSEFGSTTLKPETLISINLADYPELAIFRQPCSYGYSNYSQVNMNWKTNKFVDKDTRICDFLTGNIYQHNGVDWVVVAGETIQSLGLNKFLYSPVNKRTFYISGSGVLREVA